MGQKGKILITEDGAYDLTAYMWDDQRFSDLLVRENSINTDQAMDISRALKEEVRKMGADIVIAVNLDASYFTEENNSKTYLGFYRIADNSINIMRYHLASSDIRTADLVISPKLGTVRWREFLDPKEVAQILTNIGLEVEGTEIFEKVRGGMEGLVVGEVKTCKKHPDADKLYITTVDIGENKI